MDVTFPGGSDTWSKCFDRVALSEVVDYICVMAYDQHSKGSPVAGSTAQLKWVEENIEKILKEVPKEKLLLGIPFYTRLWKEEVTEEGKKKISSPKALTMQMVNDTILNNNAVQKWDDASGQYYAEYELDGAKYMMWIENDDSVDMKSALVHKYSLAGACIWSSNFANETVWEVLNKNLKQTTHYMEWKEAYNR